MLIIESDGWDKSKGVAAEAKIAQELNIPIHFVSEEGVIDETPVNIRWIDQNVQRTLPLTALDMNVLRIT